jgi:hypothetical protein
VLGKFRVGAWSTGAPRNVADTARIRGAGQLK